LTHFQCCLSHIAIGRSKFDAAAAIPGLLIALVRTPWLSLEPIKSYLDAFVFRPDFHRDGTVDTSFVSAGTVLIISSSFGERFWSADAFDSEGDFIMDGTEDTSLVAAGRVLSNSSSIAERVQCVSLAAHGLHAAEGNSTLPSSNASGFLPMMLLLVAGDGRICFPLALGVPVIFWPLADWLWGVVACFFLFGDDFFDQLGNRLCILFDVCVGAAYELLCDSFGITVFVGCDVIGSFMMLPNV
jgi:hypothetical protein